MSLELLTSEVMKLKRHEQIVLMQQILAKIDAESDDSEISKKQLLEIENRLQLFSEGKMKTIPAAEAHKKIARKHGLSY